MTDEFRGEIPHAHQMESLLKSILDGYREGFNDANKHVGSEVDFIMPMTFMQIDVASSGKKVLTKALEDGELTQEEFATEMVALKSLTGQKKKVKTAYLRVEKHVTTTDYRPLTHRDWFPGNVVQKLDKDAKGWREMEVPEKTDIPKGAELAGHRIEFRPVKKHLLYQTHYPFYEDDSEKKEPWRQILLFRALTHLVMGGIEFAETMARMQQNKQEQEVLKKEMDKQPKKVVPPPGIETVKSERQKVPLDADDKKYLEWLEKQRIKAKNEKA